MHFILTLILDGGKGVSELCRRTWNEKVAFSKGRRRDVNRHVRVMSVVSESPQSTWSEEAACRHAADTMSNLTNPWYEII